MPSLVGMTAAHSLHPETYLADSSNHDILQKIVCSHFHIFFDTLQGTSQCCAAHRAVIEPVPEGVSYRRRVVSQDSSRATRSVSPCHSAGDPGLNPTVNKMTKSAWSRDLLRPPLLWPCGWSPAVDRHGPRWHPKPYGSCPCPSRSVARACRRARCTERRC